MSIYGKSLSLAKLETFGEYDIARHFLPVMYAKIKEWSLIHMQKSASLNFRMISILKYSKYFIRLFIFSPNKSSLSKVDVLWIQKGTKLITIVIPVLSCITSTSSSNILAKHLA